MKYRIILIVLAIVIIISIIIIIVALNGDNSSDNTTTSHADSSSDVVTQAAYLGFTEDDIQFESIAADILHTYGLPESYTYTSNFNQGYPSIKFDNCTYAFEVHPDNTWQVPYDLYVVIFYDGFDLTTDQKNFIYKKVNEKTELQCVVQVVDLTNEYVTVKALNQDWTETFYFNE